MISSCVILAVLGFLISLYTYRTEEKIKTDPSFKPFCDISDRISCSKVVTSPYAKLFLVSNSVAGMAYYVFVAVVAALRYNHLLLAATIGGCAVSAVLAYILFAKIRTVCVLCISLYLVNVALLVCVIRAVSV